MILFITWGGGRGEVDKYSEEESLKSDVITSEIACCAVSSRIAEFHLSSLVRCDLLPVTHLQV